MSSTGYLLSEIAGWVGGELHGQDVRIAGVAGVEEAGPDQITWVTDAKYASALAASRAGAALVGRSAKDAPMPTVRCDQPALAIITVLQRLAPPVPVPAVGRHPTAVVDPTAQVSPDARIGPWVVIGAGARIGPRCTLHGQNFVGAETVLGEDGVLWPGVVVRERCTLGDRVVVHPNTTIGGDGFGYEFSGGGRVKIPQIGSVVIEDDVEIGSNCSIDRAKFGTTRIGAGTKIDNLVQVAHNVQIGPGCVIVAQCGIAGSARLEEGVVLGGKVGVRDHITLHAGVQASACSCISKDIPAGTRLMGIPAIELTAWVRERQQLHRVPQLLEQIRALTKRVEQLEAAANH